MELDTRKNPIDLAETTYCMGWALVFGPINLIRGGFPPFWTESTRGVSACLKDKAVKVVGEVREGELGFCAGQSDCSDE